MAPRDGIQKNIPYVLSGTGPFLTKNGANSSPPDTEVQVRGRLARVSGTFASLGDLPWRIMHSGKGSRHRPAQAPFPCSMRRSLRARPHFARLRCRRFTARAGPISKAVFGHALGPRAWPKREVDSRHRPPDGVWQSSYSLSQRSRSAIGTY